MSVIFKDVNFKYDTETILEGVTLSLERGHFAIVVGPNGAGKTTFLRLAAGLLKPNSGEIIIDGESCLDAQKDGKIHIVPQIYNKNAAQFPITVQEVVELVLRVEGISFSEAREKSKEALAMVGMSLYKDKRIGDLSGGQQQRVMIAQALARNASILLLDEPTSGIDFRAGEHILELLCKLRDERNLLIVMVTHDIKKALEYADQVICVNRDVCYAGEKQGFINTHLETALSWHIGG